MTTLRASSSSSVAPFLLLVAIVAGALLSGCSHSDPAASTASATEAAHAHPVLTPQQQIQQIQSDPNTPEKLKKVQMGNVSGPPLHNRVGGPP